MPKSKILERFSPILAEMVHLKSVLSIKFEDNENSRPRFLSEPWFKVMVEKAVEAGRAFSISRSSVFL
ncbi:hypothetical protein D3C85_1122190 [compost metagenome]